MALAINLLTSGSTVTASDPHATATFSPTEDAAIFLAVSMRSSDGTTFPPVPVDANDLTWTLIDRLDHDNDGTRSQMSFYRATVGSAPGTFSIDIDSTGGNRGLGWVVFEIEGVDTGAADGVVRYASSTPTQTLDWDVSAVFSQAPAVDNAVVMFTAIQQGVNEVWDHEVGFTELAVLTVFDNEQFVVTYDLTPALTTVTEAWTNSTAFPGLIAIEVLLAADHVATGELNAGGSITAVASGGDAVPTVNLLTADGIDDPTGPVSTASVTPSANATLLIGVSNRAPLGDTDMIPVVTGGGLTWTLEKSLNHDALGTMSWLQVWRAETGSSPGSFAVVMTAVTDPSGLLWNLYEVDNSDLSSTDNGVEQSASASVPAVTELTTTLGATPAGSSVVLHFNSVQQATACDFLEEVGFTEGSKIGPFASEQAAVQYIEGASPIAIDSDWDYASTGGTGGIAVEVRASSGATASVSGTINGGGSITASVTKYLNQVARPVSTITVGDWDTGPTTGQNLHDYAGDDSDATYIEDTTA